MTSQHIRSSPVLGHPNAAVARALWSAVSEADVDGIRRLLASDIEWKTYSSGVLSGSIRGVNAVIDLLARSGEIVDELTTDMIDIYASDTGAVTHYRLHAERGARSLDTEVLLVMRIDSGRVVEAFATPVDPGADETFWLSH
jgi:ketosteroid isomerase-like protein